MQFKVPQDVQREDTIIGPITIKQLIILGIGGAIAYATFVSLSKTYFIEVWLPPVAIIICITLAFAFLKIHSLPFHEFLMDFIEYHFLPRKRIWTQSTGNPIFTPSFEKKKEITDKQLELAKNAKNTKTLKELTEVLDTAGESEVETKKKEEFEKIINQNFKS